MDDNKQKKPLDERIEDTLDEALYRAQNAIYGEKNGSEDVPYTMEDASGFRKVNKFATRRNIVLKLIKKPWAILVFIGILLAVGVLVGLIT